MILYSAAYRDHTSPLFHRSKVLKFVDIVSLENCIFVNKCFNDEAFSLFSNHFKHTANINMCMCIYICVCVYMYVRICMSVYVCVYIYI